MMLSPPFRLLALALVFSVGIVAAVRAEEAKPPASAPVVGGKAENFTLDDLNGKSVSLNEMLKGGPVVLVVLRGWPGYQCPFCTRQVAELRGHANDLKSMGATVVFIYPGPAAQLKEHAEEFFKDKNSSDPFRLLIDPDFKFTNAYGLRWDAPKETSYPSTFVIDRGSVVRYAKISKTHGDRAESAEILKALAALK